MFSVLSSSLLRGKKAPTDRGRRSIYRILIEKAVNVTFGVKHHQVIDLFANADIADRKVKFFCYSDRDTALRSPVKFGQDDSGNIGRFHELPGLFEAVLSGYCVYDQQRLVRCFGNLAGRDPLHLFELCHQICLVVQPAGSIYYQDIGISRLG